MSSGLLAYDSELVRKKWMREGLIQAASKSFWTPLTGNSTDAVIYQEKNTSAADGHVVVFDYDGNLSGKAIKGKETAYGKGEIKKKFSDKLTVDRYRLPVNNGDRFDGKEIGDLSINEHADSRRKLGDLYVRWKDQSLFDTVQGNIGGSGARETSQKPTHIIDLGTTFGYDELVDIEKSIKTSSSFTTGSTRRPLDPYTTKDGQDCWLFIIDSWMATLLKKDSDFVSIMSNADVRGNANRLIKGYLGKVGAMMILEAPDFFGYTTDVTSSGTLASSYWGIESSEVEIAGMRQYDSSGYWSGEASFDDTATLHSRGMIVGKSAAQLAYGLEPDYKFQESQDFGINSESALEVWCGVGKTKMEAEVSDYRSAKVADVDYGCINVDVQVQTAA